MQKRKITVVIIIFFLFCGLIAGKEALNKREVLIAYAMSFLGTPYKASGTTRAGMDCSGFLFTSVKDSLHIPFPRTAADMFNACQKITSGPIERGDLVFFSPSPNSRINHVGIYLGDGNFIHSASDGKKTGVIISNLYDSYWDRTYRGAGRFLPYEVELEG